MSLASMQARFMAHVLDEDAALPLNWSDVQDAGLSVYRNNYRSSLMEALASTYERTARWVGKEAFQKAAIHHVLTHPPASWTLDDAGRGFDMTCAELFVNDHEVAQLAWLEWSMLDIFTMRDVTALDASGFSRATAGFTEQDWSGLRLKLAPTLTMRETEYDLLTLWNALGADEFERVDAKLKKSQTCIVWREGERPVFKLADPREAAALGAMAQGESFDIACAIFAEDASNKQELEQAAMDTGRMLGEWLNAGLIEAVLASPA